MKLFAAARLSGGFAMIYVGRFDGYVIAIILNLPVYNQSDCFFDYFERCDKPFPWIVLVALIIVNLK